MSKYANERFTKAFNAARRVPFDPKWNNATDYMDGAVDAKLDLAQGDIVASYTGLENRRRLIIVGTVFGNVVIFDRYTDNTDKEFPVFVINAPYPLRQLGLLKEGHQNEEQVLAIVGDPQYPLNEPNIGQRLTKLKEALDNPEAAIIRRRGKQLVA
jgi:hypothetical protein